MDKATFEIEKKKYSALSDFIYEDIYGDLSDDIARRAEEDRERRAAAIANEVQEVMGFMTGSSATAVRAVIKRMQATGTGRGLEGETVAPTTQTTSNAQGLPLGYVRCGDGIICHVANRNGTEVLSKLCNYPLENLRRQGDSFVFDTRIADTPRVIAVKQSHLGTYKMREELQRQGMILPTGNKYREFEEFVVGWCSLPLTSVEEPKSPRFNFKLFDQIGQGAGVKELVESTITWGGLSVWYGAPNAGKSFILAYLGYCVALGWQYNGHLVEQAGVVYFACEGGAGQESRTAAFVRHHGNKTAGAKFALVPQSINMRDSGDVDAAIKAVKEIAEAFGSVGLIVIDTLNLALAGGNENSAEDMGALFAGANRLRQETGAHVAFIHHTGKDESKGARGSSVIKGTIDSEFYVWRDETGLISVEATKQRDMDLGKPSTFTLKTVKIGTNQWGKDKTSCVVEPSNALPVAKAKKLKPESLTTLGVLDNLLPAGGSRAKYEDWRVAAYRQYELDGYPNNSTKRSKFNRSADELKAFLKISVSGDEVVRLWGQGERPKAIAPVTPEVTPDNFSSQLNELLNVVDGDAAQDS